MTDELLDRKEAASLLKISDRTLDRQTDLPRVKLTARRIVYRKSDLMAWIEAKARQGNK
jgi:predicted DNA-binding transcriptional regulator AlpA